MHLSTKFFIAALIGALTVGLLVAAGAAIYIQQNQRKEARDSEQIREGVRFLLDAPSAGSSPDVMRMPEAREILLETLQGDDQVRRRHWAAAKLHYHQGPEVISALCHALRSDPDSQVRYTSLGTLEYFGQCGEITSETSEEISRCIRDALSDSDNVVRERASSTLKLFLRGGTVVF